MPEPANSPLKLFYCYARKDKERRDDLDRHLCNLKHQKLIKVWHDRKITAGKQWQKEIYKHLNGADIVLLLVSADFLDSDYCYGKEMKRALQRHEEGRARVIAIILRPVHWEDAPFSKLQVLPTGAKPVANWINPDDAYRDIAEELSRVVKELQASRKAAAEKWFQEGVALNKLKRYEEAIVALDEAIRLDPNNVNVYRAKGHALNELKRYEEAIVALDEAIRLDSNNVNAYNARGYALNELKRYEEAIVALDEAIRLDSNNVNAYRAKGHALNELKRYEEAIVALDEAIRLDPNNVEAYKAREQARTNLEPTSAPLPKPDPVLPQFFVSLSCRRAFLIAGLTGGLAILGGGGATWWILQNGHPSPPPTPIATCVPTKGLIASDGLLTPGVLSWGADPTAGAPHVFLDANSAPIGFEVDVATAIAKLMGVTQVCYQTRYIWLEDNLRSRRTDIILNGWEVTPNRQQDESFSIPYYRYSQQLVVRTNDSHFSQYTVSSQIALSDVASYKFGTGADYKAADLLRAAGITPITSPVPLDDLRNGKIDIVMVDTPIVTYYVQGKGKGATLDNALRPIGKPLFADSTSNYVIGFKKNDPNADKLRQEIDQALNILKRDGTLKRIYQQWGLWDDFQKEIGIVDCS